MPRVSSSLAAAVAAAKRPSKTLTLTLTLAPFPRIPNPSLTHGFSSTPTSDPGSSPSGDGAAAARRPPRREAERLDETICYMMSHRPWTTRLQNSIRSLSPFFDHPLVIAVLRGARHPDQALRFFRWVEKTGFRHDSATYNEIISLLTRHSMLNHARCILLDDMPQRGVPPEEAMLAALIDGYGRAGIPQEAVKLFRRMPELGVQRSVISYNAFFKAILRRGRVMMAKRVFNHMIRDGVMPALSTYNILLWGFCLSMKMETSNRFLGDMKERGISPDVVTYNTLLNGWVRAKRMKDAEKLFDEMGRAGFSPNSISYTIMIKGFVSKGKMDDGLRLFGEMSAKGLEPSERTYAALLPGLSEDLGRTAEARKLLNEMAERGIRPKDKSMFLQLISCMSESGDLDGALEVRQVMERFRIAVESSHYGALIQGLCEGGKYDRAVEVLDELLEKGALLDPQSSTLKPSVYNPMIEYLCKHGSTKKAEAFFRQLMKKGVEDRVALNHLIRGHALEGATESAFELLGMMARREVKSDPDAYTLLVESFLRKGEPAEARTVLDSMIEQGHLPSPSLFRSVMVGLFDDGRVQTASRVMKTMIEKGVKNNMDIVHKIIEALFMRGHIEEAMGRINLLMMNDCTPEFDRLLVALCDNGKAMEAHKLADFGVDKNCNISFSSYDRVLDVLSSADKALQAYLLLCKIKATGGAVDKKGCEALIKELIAEGHTKQADTLSRILAGKATLEAKRGNKAASNAY